jgi:hypothetical protein
LSEPVTGLFLQATAIFAASTEGSQSTKALYQWLSQQASFFRHVTSANPGSRTVRTEVTIERRQGVVVLTGDVTAGFDTCPLCGSKLAPEQVEQARLRLPKGPISA